MTNKLTTLDGILDGLMSRYSERVEDVTIIIDAMIEEGMIKSAEDIENDHIAFRTLGVPNLGIASFEKIFLHCGYTKMEYMYFEGKKINAYWYAPPTPKYPRIFISELRVEDLSMESQNIILKYTKDITIDPLDEIDLDDAKAVDQFLHSPLWSLPTIEDYERLSEESEYAGWVIYNRYYLNHYTISVHNLPQPYNDLGKYDDFLLSKGIKLNDAGGVIKQSEDGLLLQSSTVAGLIEAEFKGGQKKTIAGSYVEFAERRIKPEFAHLTDGEIKREHLRDGFEVANADKIFESTDLKQTNKRN